LSFLREERGRKLRPFIQLNDLRCFQERPGLSYRLDERIRPFELLVFEAVAILAQHSTHLGKSACRPKAIEGSHPNFGFRVLCSRSLQRPSYPPSTDVTE